MYRTLSAPITVQWEVTPTCNHKCIHCYNFWRNEPHQKALPEGYRETYQKVVDELIVSKVFHVVVTGGEPLAVISQIADYLRQLRQAGIAISINTNLTLLTPKKVTLLKEIGIKSILVSLPSANPEICDFIVTKKNSLPKIIKGIRLAVESGFRVAGNMVISQYNYPDIEKTAELAYSLGLKNLTLTRASNPIPGSWFAEKVLSRPQFLEMQNLIDELRKKYSFSFESLEAVSLCSYTQDHVGKAVRSCSAGRSAMAVNFNGEIKACIRLEKSYGHISDGLQKAWLSMEDSRSEEWIPEQCGSCKLKVRCGGGCRADALVATGKINGLDGFCDPENVPVFKPKAVKKTTAIKFSVNPKIRFRVEPFGYIILLSTSLWLPVTSEMAGFLMGNSNFSVTDLAEKLSLEEPEAVNVVSLLVQKKFIEEM